MFMIVHVFIIYIYIIILQNYLQYVISDIILSVHIIDVYNYFTSILQTIAKTSTFVKRPSRGLGALTLPCPPPTNVSRRGAFGLRCKQEKEIPYAPCMEYLPTLALNITQMYVLVNIPYKEHMGMGKMENQQSLI